MPTISSIIVGELLDGRQPCYVNWDDGQQHEYTSIADFKQAMAEQAALAQEYAPAIAIAAGLKSEPDVTKSPAIGRETKLDVTLETKVAPVEDRGK